KIGRKFDIVSIVGLVLHVPAEPVVIPNAGVVRIPCFIRRLLVRELFFLKHIAQSRIVRMAETVLSIHGQLFIEVLPVIYADGLSIGKPIRTAPATATETTPEATASAPSASTAATDVEIKQAGVDIIQVTKHGKLHALLKFTIRSRSLVPFLGTATYAEVPEIAVITVGSNLEIQHPLRISRPVACKIGLIAVIVDDLDPLHDFCGKVLDGRLDVSAEKILTINPRPRDGLALRRNVPIFI